MSDHDLHWKKGLTTEQLEKVEHLESCLTNARGSLIQQCRQDLADKCQSADSQPGPKDTVVTSQDEVTTDPCTSLALPPLISCSSPSSPPPLPTCPPPSSPSTSLLPYLSQNTDTSPSLRSLNPGYVSSLALFWANRWKMENNDCSKACQDEHEHVLGGLEDFAENSSELNHLKESIMVQCDLLKAVEEENVMLKNDVIQKGESLKMKDIMIANLKSSINDCTDKLSMLIMEDAEKNRRFVKTEENFVKISYEKEALETKCRPIKLHMKEVGSNLEEKKVTVEKNCCKIESEVGVKSESEDLHDIKENLEKRCVRMEQDLRDKNSILENLKSKNSQLFTKLSQYEEIVKDLRNQIVPKENLNVKMESLNQDVTLLRSRLQNRISHSKCQKMTAENNLAMTVPSNKSIKRRWTVEDQDVTSSAKMIKLAETSFNHNHTISMSDTRTRQPTPCQKEYFSFSKSLAKKGKFEECKQQ